MDTLRLLSKPSDCEKHKDINVLKRACFENFFVKTKLTLLIYKTMGSEVKATIQAWGMHSCDSQV